MLERRRKSGKERGGGEMKEKEKRLLGRGSLGVLEKRFRKQFRVALRNHSQTDNALNCDCGAVRTPRPTEIGTIRVG